MIVLSKVSVSRGVKVPAHGRVEEFRCGPTRSSIHETPHQKKFRIALLNVGTLRGRSSEVVETMCRRKVDLCCLQEIRWHGASACMIEGNDSCYKIFWVGNENGSGGVGFLPSEEWIEKIFDINRVSDHIMMMKRAIDTVIIMVLSYHVLQVGLDNVDNDTVYDQLQAIIRRVDADKTLVICCDVNGHISKLANGYEGVLGGYSYGLTNKESEHILEFAVAHNLVVGNSYFTKKDNHMITYPSGGINSQIDYIFVGRLDFLSW